MPHPALSLQPAGDIVHYRPGKAGARPPPPAIVAMAQAAFHPDVEYCARRHGVLPDTTEPGCGAGRAGRNLIARLNPVMMRVRCGRSLFAAPGDGMEVVQSRRCAKIWPDNAADKLIGGGACPDSS